MARKVGKEARKERKVEKESRQGGKEGHLEEKSMAEGVSRAGGVGRRLSVALDSEIGHQPSSFHCTSDETMAQQVQGMARRKGGSVVTND
ncbi:hypothetical protein EYF80_006238 [Liparis tanakae]|uniref:Uncharacterized protein n=1 Tax=Liparis tanakae TaxID=230148 RepID=A0A4Z2J0B7_9TELE|nr:hypothetical protein EYF80_006238 [Liparis tanakae]